MKKYNIVETIRLFVMNAQTDKALDELYKFCSQHNLSHPLDQIVILSSNLAEIRNAEISGLGNYIEEKNRLNLNLLKIIKQLDKEIPTEASHIPTSQTNPDQLSLLESKIDFLVRHVEINDNLAYYGFRNSPLWEELESSSQEQLTNANIIEKEVKQGQYSRAIKLYLTPVMIELEMKLFSKFKATLELNSIDKHTIIAEFNGNNKDKFFNYLKSDYEMSLNQISEFLLANIFYIDKQELKGLGKEFNTLFYKVYKVRSQKNIIDFFQIYQSYKLSSVDTFVQTLGDVIQAKENAVDFFVNLQPKKRTSV